MLESASITQKNPGISAPGFLDLTIDDRYNLISFKGFDIRFPLMTRYE